MRCVLPLPRQRVLKSVGSGDRARTTTARRLTRQPPHRSLTNDRGPNTTFPTIWTCALSTWCYSVIKVIKFPAFPIYSVSFFEVFQYPSRFHKTPTVFSQHGFCILYKHSSCVFMKHTPELRPVPPIFKTLRPPVFSKRGLPLIHFLEFNSSHSAGFSSPFCLDTKRI